jgi:prepilin-type N-terminal cleavage/methylation domain-containing protein
MPRLTRVRRGLSLVEIMVALVLLGIVSGVIMRVVQRQQRFYQGVNQIVVQRSQLRQATSVLPIDLRGLSSVGNDILVASDSSIVFNVTVGTGVVCELSGNSAVAMPPEVLANDQNITSWYGYGKPDPKNKPKSAYTVYIYNDSSSLGNQDDVWQPFTLADVTGDKTKCVGGATPFTTIGDVGKERPVLTLKNPTGVPNDPVTGGPLSQYVGVGAPVRIVKQVRYKLFKASDGKWYLGYSDYNATTSDFDPLSPVSGPYDAYSTSSSGTGIGFRYYDVDGNEIASGAGPTDRAKIARVDLIARARTSSNVRAAGFQNGANQQYKDSLAVSVMLRNRN